MYQSALNSLGKPRHLGMYESHEEACYAKELFCRLLNEHRVPRQETVSSSSNQANKDLVEKFQIMVKETCQVKDIGKYATMGHEEEEGQEEENKDDDSVSSSSVNTNNAESDTDNEEYLIAM